MDVLLSLLANYGMCGRAYSPRFLYMWPNARIGVMGGNEAANVLWRLPRAIAEKGEKSSQGGRSQVPAAHEDKYEVESSCYYSTSSPLGW